MSDETTLATDLAKVGISSAALYSVGLYTMNSFVVMNLAVVVIAGIGVAVVLNYLDNKYHITDRLVNFIAPYIESAQQEFVEKSREVSDGILDLGAMYVDGMLRKGRQVIEAEVKQYVKKYIGDLTSQVIDL